jgi:H+-translocating NAD(P) transhydrogenase subunit alpha
MAAAPCQGSMPMLMTDAGIVKAERVVLLNTVVQASDMRPVVKEGFETFGAKFIDVPCETG